ncbi:hypothetical protein Pd630_LPD09060 (plasmid) [Rhodococcus opacus PD630]|nr:hypothetical protein Pd630_LPD09060 [Rhodococcus opacus PD630]
MRRSASPHPHGGAAPSDPAREEPVHLQRRAARWQHRPRCRHRRGMR